jgi:hypothetical protein
MHQILPRIPRRRSISKVYVDDLCPTIDVVPEQRVAPNFFWIGLVDTNIVGPDMVHFACLCSGRGMMSVSPKAVQGSIKLAIYLEFPAVAYDRSLTGARP